mgnify:CR=1 FL=1
MDNRAMYTLSYGLFLLSAQADGFDNACIINTACQVTSTPNRLTVAVNNANFTTGMIEKSGAFNLSVLDETAPFSVFEAFGFRSGRDGSKLDGVEYARSENGLIYLPAHAAAYLSCKVESVTDLGTHKLFLAQVTDGAATVGGKADALGVKNLVVEVPAKQTMDEAARNALSDALTASGVEHTVFWDDAAGLFR